MYWGKGFTLVWAAATHSRQTAAVGPVAGPVAALAAAAVAVRLLRHRPFPVAHYDAVSKNVAHYSRFYFVCPSVLGQ